MKRFNIVIAAANRSRKGAPTAATAIICLLVLWLVTACTATDDDSAQSAQSPTGMATVTLRIAAQAEGMATRAWQDTNAKTDRSEMMFSWVVLITDGSTIKYKYAATDLAEGEAEIDNVCTDVEMPAGTYTAYSFANISEESLKTMLGVSSLEQGTALLNATVTAATATINGNGFTPSVSSVPSVGIPMSNRQTFTVPSSGSLTKDLIVVRMLAKMKVSIKNETGASQHIKYATISNVTDNVDNNLMLLPKWTSTTGEDDMTVVQHGDLQPNLHGTPATTELAIPGMASDAELANGETREVTFYINECKKPTEFYLTIGLGDATNTHEYRYALIDNRGDTSDDNDKWNYIARNDYRVIPVVLDNYKFELIPYDFPPIGVYPVSVREIDTENHIFDFTFHDYGHFHLLPRVVNTSDNSVVEYSATTPTGTAWTLNTDWAGTWYTATTKGGPWLDADGITDNGFYRGQTATADGDDAGGVPSWYLNDGVSGPQWDPAASGTTYRPFIFGYIADPGTPFTTDKRIYHEMKIRLYVDGQYRRDMLYRFYMTLSPSQMLNARRTGFARSCQH